MSILQIIFVIPVIAFGGVGALLAMVAVIHTIFSVASWVVGDSYGQLWGEAAMLYVAAAVGGIIGGIFAYFATLVA